MASKHSVRHARTFFMAPRTFVSVAVLLAVSTSVTAQTAQTPPQPAEAESRASDAVQSAEQRVAAEREAWRRKLITTPLPRNGCFTAAFPEQGWRPEPCKPGTPHEPMFPRSGVITSIDTVGGLGPDFVATVTGHIAQSEGSFDSVTGVTSTGAYSLQLNTDYFLTDTCNAAPGGRTGTCRGWEQFVYASDGVAFIQYWLVNFAPSGTSCPAPTGASCDSHHVFSDGWCPFAANGGLMHCAINAAAEPSGVTAKSLSSIGSLKMSGLVASGGVNDQIIFTDSGTPHAATGDNRFTDLGSVWQQAEFNVFGHGGSGQIAFNSGSNLRVRTEVLSGSRAAPGCSLVTFTGESSTLTLSNTPPGSSSPTPGAAIVFDEQAPAPAGAVASCLDAVSWGDTHMTTFGGLAYDFQARGDYVLMQAGPEFMVQARLASAAPTYPNASYNKAVGVQSGKNHVAVCLGGRVVVNGKAISVPDGHQHNLPGGGAVIRRADTYVVLDPNGHTMRATVNQANIDVTIGLGRWPMPVTGLLANHNSNDVVVSRDGNPLSAPLAFDALYGHYRQSWQVRREESVLSYCGIAAGAAPPKAPFYARNLPRAKSLQVQAICTKAGVKKGPLLEACMLDVAVLGPKAVQAYRNRTAPVPVVVGDAGQ